jgi:hypothetical protein
VYFGLLPKTRKHRNGPPLSTRASLHARPWSEVDREARQISCPSKQREALAPTKNCVSAASLMNLRKNRGARQRAAHHAIHKGAKLCPSLFPIWLSRREFASFWRPPYHLASGNETHHHQEGPLHRSTRLSASALPPRRPRASHPMETSLQTRVCYAGSAGHHRLPVRRGGMVADRSLGLAARRRDPRCELALHAPWHYADEQNTYGD